jgi:putative endonuclease
VYLLRCQKGELYGGATNDIEERLEKHNTGKGAKYTRGRGPLLLAWLSKPMTMSEAYKLEYRVKKLTRLQKLELIAGTLDPRLLE